MDGRDWRSVKSPMYLLQNVSISASYRLSVPSEAYKVALSFDHVDLQVAQMLFYDDWEETSLIGNITGGYFECSHGMTKSYINILTATNETIESRVNHIKDFMSSGTKMSIDVVLDAKAYQTFSASMDWVTKGYHR